MSITTEEQAFIQIVINSMQSDCTISKQEAESIQFGRVDLHNINIDIADRILKKLILKKDIMEKYIEIVNDIINFQQIKKQTY